MPDTLKTLFKRIQEGMEGLAGAVMQGVTRNPLAEPGLLGINGAGLARILGVSEATVSRIARGERGLPPDNHLRLDDLSNVERAHLKSAFGIVQRLQSVLATRYQGGRF